MHGRCIIDHMVHESYIETTRCVSNVVHRSYMETTWCMTATWKSLGVKVTWTLHGACEPMRAALCRDQADQGRDTGTTPVEPPLS